MRVKWKKNSYLTHRNPKNEEKLVKIWNVRRVTDALKRPKWLSKQDWCSKEASLILLSFTQSREVQWWLFNLTHWIQIKIFHCPTIRIRNSPSNWHTLFYKSNIDPNIQFCQNFIFRNFQFFTFPDYEFPPIFKLFPILVSYVWFKSLN